MSQIKVFDSKDEPLLWAFIPVRLGINNQNSDEAYDERITYNGATAFPNPLPSISGYNLYINDHTQYNYNINYNSITLHVPNLDNDIIITLNPTPIQKIHIEGDKFINESGYEWKWAMGTNFMLPQLVAEGIDIRPFLYKNVNGFRLFGTHKIISEQVGLKPFDPSFYTNWLESIEKCIDILYDNNYYCQLNLLCDRQYLPGDKNWMNELVHQVDEMAKNKKNLFFSLGNENEKNGFNTDDFSKPVNIISACGSGLTGGPAPLCRGEAWDIQHQHLRRDRKMFIDIPPVDAPTYDKNHIIIFDETIAWSNHNDGSNTNNIDDAYKLGAIARAYNGITIHIRNGVHSQILNDNEEQSLVEFKDGIEG